MNNYYLIMRLKKGEIDAISNFDNLPKNFIPVFFIDDDSNLKLFKKLQGKFMYYTDSSELEQSMLEELRITTYPVKIIKGWNEAIDHPSTEVCYYTNLEDINISAVPENLKATLIIDLKDQIPQEQWIIGSLQEKIAQLKELGWNDVAIGGTSAPASMADVKKGIDFIERKEWTIIYKSFLSDWPDLSFCDYGVVNPASGIGFDPRLMSPSAKIRYTTDTDFMILKGSSTKKGFGQFRELSKALIEHEEYCGQDYSWGDKYVYDCANNRVGPGNLTTWISVDTSHHIAKVTTQLANLS